MKTEERLADYAHNAWCGWMVYLFDKSYPVSPNGTVIIPAELVKRWRRQMNTPYKDLPEKEKESDRVEARKMLGIVRDQFALGVRAAMEEEEIKGHKKAAEEASRRAAHAFRMMTIFRTIGFLAVIVLALSLIVYFLGR